MPSPMNPPSESSNLGMVLATLDPSHNEIFSHKKERSIDKQHNMDEP